MFARLLMVLATFSLCVGVEIKFQKLQDRPPLQFSPKLPARPVWVQSKAPVGQQQIRFPEDPLQTVKIFENYTTTNVEKSQDGKNISVIELLGILHDLPPNETLSAVNQRITSTTESNLETLNRLRKTKLEETREGDSLVESSTITTTTTTHVDINTVVATTTTTMNPGDREETSTLPVPLETTNSYLSHLDQVEEVTTTPVIPLTDEEMGIKPAKDEQATFETLDSNENKISSENILVDKMSSVAPTESVIPVFSTSTVASPEVEEPQVTSRPKDELMEVVDENGIGHTEISTSKEPAVVELVLTHTILNNSHNNIMENQSTEEVTSTQATTAKSAKTTWSQDCSDGLNVSRCFPDNSTSTSMDVVLIGSISGGIFLVLVIVISILSVCLCKRSHNRKNVYATMEEEQPKDFTKVGPPVILQDEVFEAGRSRLYTRNTDKVTEL